MENNNAVVVMEESSLMSVESVDSIVAMSEKADAYVKALNKIMEASVKITNEYDWVLIGGKPYLQESGANKVARLFGISWKINDGYPKKHMEENGHYTYSYRMTFFYKNESIEAEGGRSSNDDFFSGKDHSKSPDLINERNVRNSAYTNCVNNGIKRILPGVRNITVDVLEKAGLDLKNVGGYTFKTGSKGGTNQKAAADSGLKCECCGKPITQKVASYAEAKFGKKLCMDCQKKPVSVDEAAPPAFEDVDGDIPF